MAGKRMTKSQIIGELADKTGLTKKDVNSVFEEMRNLVKRELGRRGPGEFVVPDMLKLKVKNV
ncbi:MAG: HU family DNA-binding protein, partial [Myxococcales bacterium]|nr:HU family DNA-binding protein [Myxococcales bacterium]